MSPLQVPFSLPSLPFKRIVDFVIFASGEKQNKGKMTTENDTQI